MDVFDIVFKCHDSTSSSSSTLSSELLSSDSKLVFKKSLLLVISRVHSSLEISTEAVGSVSTLIIA